MRSHRIGTGLLAALAGLGAASFIREIRPEPASQRLIGHRISRTDEHPAYPRNTPRSDFDHERIRVAEMKRARKAIKRQRDYARSQAGYYFAA